MRFYECSVCFEITREEDLKEFVCRVVIGLKLLDGRKRCKFFEIVYLR